MRLAKIGLAAVVAAAALAAPTAAEAQDGEGKYCLRNTDTALDGQCLVGSGPVCIPFTSNCVEGVWENVDGAIEFILDARQQVEETIPDRVCTPTTPFGAPICVTG